jgi:hypothetical protein
VADVRTVEHYQIEAVGKKIEVPAGVFSDCVMVRMEVRITEEHSMINRITFAPGVGILEIYVSLKKGAERMIRLATAAMLRNSTRSEVRRKFQ